MNAGGDDRALRTAAVLAAVETTGLIVLVLANGGLRVPLRLGALALKYPFCALVVRRNPGAFMGLLLWEFAGASIALAASGTTLFVRLPTIAVALTVIVLLFRSMHLFPEPRLPER